MACNESVSKSPSLPTNKMHECLGSECQGASAASSTAGALLCLSLRLLHEAISHMLRSVSAAITSSSSLKKGSKRIAIHTRPRDRQSMCGIIVGSCCRSARVHLRHWVDDHIGPS